MTFFYPKPWISFSKYEIFDKTTRYVVFEKSESVDKVINYGSEKVLKFEFARVQEQIVTVKITDKIGDECDAYASGFKNCSF